MLIDRGKKDEDFSSFLYSIGYRLTTFVKLVIKISRIMVDRYGVHEDCMVIKIKLFLISHNYKKKFFFNLNNTNYL